jgi:hypothetical protein
MDQALGPLNFLAEIRVLERILREQVHGPTEKFLKPVPHIDQRSAVFQVVGHIHRYQHIHIAFRSKVPMHAATEREQ